MTYLNSNTVKNYECFSIEAMKLTPKEAAYRVPMDAEYALLTLCVVGENIITIKGGDTVLGGKDKTFSCGDGDYGVILEISQYIQHSGPHKGCILLESTAEDYESDLFVFSK